MSETFFRRNRRIRAGETLNSTHYFIRTAEMMWRELMRGVRKSGERRGGAKLKPIAASSEFYGKNSRWVVAGFFRASDAGRRKRQTSKSDERFPGSIQR